MSDEELLKIVLDADEEGFLSGEEPKARSFRTTGRAMRRLGYIEFWHTGSEAPPEVVRIKAIVRSLYRVEDIAIGGIHMGAFMFRDVFAKVSIPIGFGRYGLSPHEHVDLNQQQLGWLLSRPQDSSMFYDQYADIFDFGWGADEIGQDRPVNQECKDLFRLAKLQSQGAAAVVTGAYDYRGAVQAAILSTELAMKAGLAAHGYDEGRRRAFGHNGSDMLSDLAPFEPTMDAPRMQKVLSGFPDYVHSRYASTQPGRVATGHIVMGAQYVIAEVMRQFSKRNFRARATPPFARAYPAFP